jgi:hypothetical protein
MSVGRPSAEKHRRGRTHLPALRAIGMMRTAARLRRETGIIMNADQNGKRIRREPDTENLAIGFDMFGSNNRVRRCCRTHAQSLIMKGGYASLGIDFGKYSTSR